MNYKHKLADGVSCVVWYCRPDSQFPYTVVFYGKDYEEDDRNYPGRVHVYIALNVSEDGSYRYFWAECNPRNFGAGKRITWNDAPETVRNAITAEINRKH